MPALLPVGSNLRNRYRIHSPLAQTKYCNIYVAQDGHLTNKFWVIKEISIYGFSPGDRSKLSQLFQAEAYQASALDHVCLPKLIDFFAQGQCLYLVREFVPGFDLASLLEGRRILPETEIINVGIQLCDLLIYLQSKNSLNSLGNDLKLTNIVMRNDGRIAMLDIGFTTLNGILKSGEEQLPAYPPPEQFTGAFSSENKKLVYMVGAILYNLLTNVSPSGASFGLPALESLRQGLSASTKSTVSKAMRNDPRDRFNNLSDLRNGLVKSYQIAAKRAGMKPTGSMAGESSPPPSWLWILGMIFACLIGGAMVVIYQMFLR